MDLKKILLNLSEHLKISDMNVIFKDDKVELWISFKDGNPKKAEELIKDINVDYLDIFLIKE